MYHSKVIGVGHYVPKKVMTNADLVQYMDTTNEWIIERTGIEERRFAEYGVETNAYMSKQASLMALERAGLTANDIDCIVFSTLSPDYYFPGVGVLLQRELGIADKHIPCIDLRAQCAGFLYALQVADSLIKSGTYKRILLACSEIQSNIMELSDRGRSMSVIFGDGSGALVLEAHSEKGKGVLSTHLHADGTYAEELFMRHPGTQQYPRITPEMIENGDLLPYMNGSAVFKHAVVHFENVIRESLDANKLTVSDIDLLIPHQANLRISKFIQAKLELPDEKVFNNIQRYGNTTAASIPIAMSEAFGEGKIKEGTLLSVAAFGSGFVWASALIRF